MGCVVNLKKEEDKIDPGEKRLWNSTNMNRLYMNITCLPPCRLRAACLRASADNNSASAHA